LVDQSHELLLCTQIRDEYTTAHMIVMDTLFVIHEEHEEHEDWAAASLLSLFVSFVYFVDSENMTGASRAAAL
jgi:hypothetical protein